MVLLHSEMVALGTEAHPFDLPGVDDRTYSLFSFKDKDILVIIFMCNHCPYVKAVLDRLIAIQHDYPTVQLVGINSNESENYPEDSFPNMKKTALDKVMNFPYLHDESQSVAKKYQAVCTPDIFVYDKDRKLTYRGRIDDNWQKPNEVTSHDLRDALDALLKGEKPSDDQHPSMGCSIKWR